MSTSEENHPPASPSQAEDPPETAASIFTTIHPEALSCAPPLPDLPPLDVLLQTQEWSTTTIDDEDNPAPHDTPIQEEAHPPFKTKRMRVSFAYKGVRALKAFFLTNLQEELSSRIPDDVFLDGIIISTPRKGKSDAYHIKWNASTLAVVVNESRLCTVVSKYDHVFISQLKVARVTFDEYYPNGPPTSVASLIHCKKKESNKISKMQHQASNPKKKRKVVPAEQEVPTSQVASSSRSITTLRMAPIFASMTEAHNNQTVDNNSPNDDDSDPDDELLEFTADITKDYNNIELLQEADRLYGYTPDDGYDAQMMEEDGVYPHAFTWTYERVPSEGLQEDYYHYNCRGPALRHNVCNKFVSLLEPVEKYLVFLRYFSGIVNTEFILG